MDNYIDHPQRYHETMKKVLRTAGEAGAKGLDKARKGRIAALCGKDSEAGSKAAQGLRPPCVKAFLMFCDFGWLE
jgi:hypothetical protein